MAACLTGTSGLAVHNLNFNSLGVTASASGSCPLTLARRPGFCSASTAAAALAVPNSLALAWLPIGPGTASGFNYGTVRSAESY